MDIFSPLWKLVSALVSALAVVFGLEADPTAIPVEVESHPRSHTR